jgi:recombination protein RecA
VRPSIAELARLVSALSPSELASRCVRRDARDGDRDDARDGTRVDESDACVDARGGMRVDASGRVRGDARRGARVDAGQCGRAHAEGESRAPIQGDVHARREAHVLWSQPELAGRLIELSGRGASAVLTLAFAAVRDAQMRGETAAWITSTHSSFFPPDAAASGIDLDALTVVRLPRAADVAHAADQLARSSAFGIIVLDLERRTSVPPPLLTRLSGLARKHDTAILFLLEPAGRPSASSSLGSLVSLRGEASRTARGSGRFACELVVVKDRLRPRGWKETEVYRGPAGLR